MSVILVGAGPGSRGLLTLRGAQALQAAEVVIYDRLVGQEILAMMPDTAEKINVGKQSSHHLVPQEQINQILIEKAQGSKRVVRLKGGDCYLFGRGGEEAEALAKAGVDFEIVPGVTSALSVPAFAGIPVTHRDFCSSVHIITAHARAGSQLHIDFDHLVQIKGTLVFLMGVTALPFIMEGLQKAGMSRHMPAAVIENGTRYNQRKLVADIGTLTEKAAKMKLHSPAIIIVGKVCALSDTLDFWTHFPLHNRQIVVTRPKDRIGTLSARLCELGAGVIEYPCIETQEIEDTQKLKKALDFSYDWVVFTSPAGVTAAMHMLERIQRDFRAFYGCKFAVIGKTTAKKLEEFGIIADFIPETYDAAHLAEGLLPQLKADDAVLLLRAAQASEILLQRLQQAQIVVADIPVYHTVYRSEKSPMLTEQIAAGEIDTVTFTSASTVHAFMQATPHADVSRFTALCIGKVTEQTAKSYGMRCKTAKNATIDDMIACLLENE